MVHASPAAVCESVASISTAKMSKIFNKVCVVTGGGAGIGRALCEGLAAAGARGVYVVDINIESAKEVAGCLSSIATHPDFRSGFDIADVGKEDDLKRIITSAWDIFGSVDAYFSNAGIFTIGGVEESEVSNKAWENIWNINVMSHVYGARHLFSLWKRSNHQGGVFVITGSAAGLLMQPGCLPYHVTKHAAVSVADWLAVTHRPDEVSVHCVCPQMVRTNMLMSSMAAAGDNEKDEILNAGPFGPDGILEPKDVAAATIEGIDNGTFIIYPHPQVRKYFRRKASDYDRWIKGMRKVNERFLALNRTLHQQSKL